MKVDSKCLEQMKMPTLQIRQLTQKQEQQQQPLSQRFPAYPGGQSQASFSPKSTQVPLLRHVELLHWRPPMEIHNNRFN